MLLSCCKKKVICATWYECCPRNATEADFGHIAESYVLAQKAQFILHMTNMMQVLSCKLEVLPYLFRHVENKLYVRHIYARVT